MAMPTDMPIIDTMIGFPHADMKEVYSFITRQTKDRESKEEFAFPAEYMFKQVPEKQLTGSGDPVAVTLGEMDRWGIEKGMIGVSVRTGDEPETAGERALRQHPDRFFGSVEGDPNKGMDGIRAITRAYETFGVKAVSAFPAGTFPQVAINDKLMYPIYAKCVELGIPIFCCAGVPGPRLKFAPQRVELIDEVMFDFPELVFVTRHGCEPWADLAAKLLLKWPNLYYSTSAFAPRYYPKAIIDFANTRGADKIIYAGYFPMGLSIERIMTEMPNVGFKDDVWPKFLHDNAVRVLKLDS
jgi:predicted TIM-barrel fold metal-dependent hydrolase